MKALIVSAVLAVVFGLIALISWILMLAWNYGVANLFEVKQMTFWVAFWIIVLLSIVGSYFRKK